MNGGGVESATSIEILVNGRLVRAAEGQTLAGALAAAGYRVFRHTERGEPRGLFCGMGVCFECLVTVDGVPNQRACMTPVRQGCQVELPTAPVGPRGKTHED